MSTKPVSVTPGEGFALHVGFADGTSRVIDIEPYLDRGVFRELRDRAIFVQAELDPLGGIEWPNGASLSPERVAGEIDVSQRPRLPVP